MIQARALALESCKFDDAYTKFFILADIHDTSDLDLIPKPDREDVTIELRLPYTVPQPPPMDFSDAQRLDTISKFLSRKLRSAMRSRPTSRTPSGSSSWFGVSMMQSPRTALPFRSTCTTQAARR